MAYILFWEKIERFFRIFPCGFNIKFDNEHKIFYSTNGFSKRFHSINTILNFLQMFITLLLSIKYLDEEGLPKQFKIIRVICLSVTFALNVASVVFYWKLCKPGATFIVDANTINGFQNTTKSNL